MGRGWLWFEPSEGGERTLEGVGRRDRPPSSPPLLPEIQEPLCVEGEGGEERHRGAGQARARGGEGNDEGVAERRRSVPCSVDGRGHGVCVSTVMEGSLVHERGSLDRGGRDLGGAIIGEEGMFGDFKRERFSGGSRKGRPGAFASGQSCASPGGAGEVASSRCGRDKRAYGGRKGRGATGRGEYGERDSRRDGLHGSGVALWFLVAFVMVQACGGYITLSDKGYSFKHPLLASAGLKVDGDVRVNGMIVSKPVANLQCNPSRKGAMRWNQHKFEACDGVNDWKPMSFCDRDCNLNTNAIPCGIPVRNKCDKLCKQTGTGLNMRQCLLATSTTQCNTPVKDLCDNACGLTGAMG